MLYGWLAQNDSGDTSRQWFAIAIGVLGLAYILLRPKFGRKKRDPLETRPLGSLSQQRSLEREMNSLVVELSEMARQITAQLDTRSARLELLIREADEKIARIEQLRGEGADAGGAGDGYPPAGPALSQAAEPAAEADARHAEIYELADAGHSAHDIAQRLDRPSGEIELILALRSSANRQ